MLAEDQQRVVNEKLTEFTKRMKLRLERDVNTPLKNDHSIRAPEPAESPAGSKLERKKRTYEEAFGRRLSDESQ